MAQSKGKSGIREGGVGSQKSGVRVRSQNTGEEFRTQNSEYDNCDFIIYEQHNGVTGTMTLRLIEIRGSTGKKDEVIFGFTKIGWSYALAIQNLTFKI